MSRYPNSKETHFEWKVKDPINAQLVSIRTNIGGNGKYIIELCFSNGEKGGFYGSHRYDEYTLDATKGTISEIRVATWKNVKQNEDSNPKYFHLAFADGSVDEGTPK